MRDLQIAPVDYASPGLGVVLIRKLFVHGE